MAHPNRRGGYKFEFVALDATLKCQFCFLALRSPFQTECGHRYCEDCIKNINGNKCPLDDKELTPESIFRDEFCNRQILELQCFCRNKNLGCEWTGRLRVIERHHKDCLFVEGTCPNEGCNAKMLKRLFGKHMMQECKYKKPPQRFMKIDAKVKHCDEKMLSETTSYDGTFLWKIDDFGRRLQDAVAGRCLSIYSPDFYVGQFGYKVCARVYLNGSGMGKGTHLSIFLVVMHGENDDLLPWPFQQEVSFKFVDQTGDQDIVDSLRPVPSSSRFQRPTSNMNIAGGCPLFVPKSVLDSRGFIQDTVFIEITVDTTGMPSRSYVQAL
ncbi:TNF receptor-associated factor 3 [Paramuricea clavata]|uniref:TNF receptor-associated factor 3 n=1 Tax=Paramuricea clavata TaxID=317549 RepID=A0A6S7HS93_PARCT|nr:TNF receptor-associated factor 3 [Paramuricea clavata]